MEEGKKKKKDVQRTFLQLHVKKSQHQPSFLLLPSFCIDFVPKNFLFLLSGKTKHDKQYTYFRILTWMWIRVPSGFLSGFSNIFNPKMVCISFPKVINECLVLLFATRNLSFLFLISQLSQFASKAEVIFVNFCLGLWRRRKWEDICKIIFIVGFEL